MLSTLKRFVSFVGKRQLPGDEPKSETCVSGSVLTATNNSESKQDKDSATWQTISREDLEALERENELLSNGHRQAWSLVSGRLKGRKEYVVKEDITNGCERYKIPALSYKKGDKAPEDYHYVNEYVESKPVCIERTLDSISSCNCKGGNCSQDANCNCSTNDKFKSMYNSKGRLNSHYNFSSPFPIYECNPLCGCNKKSCGNMVIQNGCRARLVLFRTKSRGWGVKTFENLRRGTFVGIYSGELISGEESLRRKDDTYLFNLSTSDIALQSNGNSAGQFVCDAMNYGNFTRFINHSCEPNVVGIRSFTKHQDNRFPYIAFFTNKDIPARTELTLNYGDNYWIIKCKRDKIFCLCKRSSCRFSKRSFPETQKQREQERRK